MQKKKSIIIDDRTYFETARTPLHIEYECYETYTDKEGHEHSYTLVEIRPRNFLGRFADWIDDVSLEHPIAFYGTVSVIIIGILIRFRSRHRHSLRTDRRVSGLRLLLLEEPDQ